MTVRISSPVLVPFGHDIGVIEFLCELDKEVYIAPMYHCWGIFSEFIIRDLPSEYTLNYIKNKIDDDITGIVKTSKYYSLFSHLFNKETAELIDKLYQIEFDDNHKKIIAFLLSSEIEKNIDDQMKFKKVNLNLERLNYIFDNLRDYIKKLNLKTMEVKFIREELRNQKFSTIVDSIYRKERLYTPQYLGFVSLFTGKKETLKSWNVRLDSVVKNNLIHGGYIILLDYPNEYKTKIKNILVKSNSCQEIDNKIWKKPDIMLTKIRKGIKKYY